MSHKIYRSELRTGLGRATLEIFDNNEGVDTPPLLRGEIYGGLKLKQDDTGKSGKGLPLSRGSYFTITIDDNDKKEFQSIFRRSFSKYRYSVRLTIHGFGLWVGYVKPDLQTRAISGNSDKNTVTITCYDGLGDLSSQSEIKNTASKTTTLILKEILELANPNLEIAAYIDFEAKNIDNNFVGIQNLVPTANPENTYAPGSGDLEGLEGSDPRQQLDNLCKTFNATLFQDIRSGHWSFIDVASIGKPVTGVRFGGGSWSTYTFPEQIVEQSKKEVITASDNELESLSSVKGVLVEAEEWSKDPRMEQYPNQNAGSLYYWEHTNALQDNTSSDPKSSTILPVASSSDYVRQTVDVNVQIENIDQVWFSVVEEDSSSDIIGTITYGDGSTSQNTGTNTYEVFVDVDQTKDVIQSVKLEVTNQSATHIVILTSIKFLSINTVPDLQGNTDTEKEIVNRFLYQTDKKGRDIYKDEGAYAVVLSTNDAASTPREWRLKSTGNKYDKLMRARAVRLLALKAPGLENIRTKVNQQFLPLGTRIRITKRDNPNHSDFVSLKGRNLLIGTNMDAGTEINDLELPNALS